ncbi:magnesium/cobalt transporter CorA [Desulfosporosinus sp.]|uniref:magnesium/cobalt transporter CorA n=1 Tax=Desulfosporosinus sp. TaxID=157907 RepID=UPI00230CE7B5|nr:magnesium/cobalt transporter CorA [Desulfosporosinus sp.]MCO5387707.1 magnesium/cobalt transporter CorA [Desulfosporosinus sp.]MDA8224070.1 magnesium/cobalt transporter CorA [Desulfitobacterium hafniense]
MIRTFGLKKDSDASFNFNLDSLGEHDFQWYWVDFDNPSEPEIDWLRKYFKFHPLSIEDSIYSLNKPKLDYYEGYSFFILNALKRGTLGPSEISLFVDQNYIISFHTESLTEIDEAWERVTGERSNWEKGPSFVAYQILDKIVDQYFPAVYEIEDKLDRIDSNLDNKSSHKLLDDVFQIRGDLLKLRRIVTSMRDLLYRILNSERLPSFKEHKLYFSDIHDHLLKLTDMIESNREITSDLRDSYLSMNSNWMNKNMMVLTVITTIFIPLNFVAGIYGMNFENMPELNWKYGYFIVLGVMIGIGISMFLWFKRKGWFNT